MFNLVIDAGHGGKDPGAVGNGLNEKDINLSVALLLKEKLAPYKKEINLKLTRETDVFLELSDRVKISNAFKADLFVSIHCNSSNNTSAQGVETYCYRLSNQKGAKLIHEEIIASKAFTVNRKVKEANFYVVKNTTAHAVLCELAFISNTNDAKILKNKQNDLAEAILKGILRYFNVKYKGPTQNAPETSQNVSQGTSSSTRKLWRVCLGTFEDINYARKLKDEAISKGFKDAFVVEK